MPVPAPVPARDPDTVAVLVARATAFEVGAGGVPALVECFAAVPDPRDARGIRHPIEVILGLCTAAVLSGCVMLVEITTWVTHAEQDILAAFGCRRDEATGACTPPHRDTVTRVLEAIDAAELADLTGAHLGARAGIARPPPRSAPRPACPPSRSTARPYAARSARTGRFPTCSPPPPTTTPPSSPNAR